MPSKARMPTLNALALRSVSNATAAPVTPTTILLLAYDPAGRVDRFASQQHPDAIARRATYHTKSIAPVDRAA